jgi:thioesterase domain-containing protein
MIRLSPQLQQRAASLPREKRERLRELLSGRNSSMRHLDSEPQAQVLRFGSGDNVDIAFMHPVSGYCFCYAALTEGLSGRPGFLCIEHPDASRPAHVRARSFSELAQIYRAAVIDACGGVPPIIGGWSLGGALALEMARQWEDEGVSVGAVFMIDSPLPECRGVLRLRSILDLRGDHAASLAEEVAFMRDHPDFIELAQRFYRVPAVTTDADTNLIGIYAANAAALARHVFRPVQAAVTYLLAECSPSSETMAETETRLRAVCRGRWEARGLLHDHFSIVEASGTALEQLVQAVGATAR